MSLARRGPCVGDIHLSRLGTHVFPMRSEHARSSVSVRPHVYVHVSLMCSLALVPTASAEHAPARSSLGPTSHSCVRARAHPQPDLITSHHLVTRCDWPGAVLATRARGRSIVAHTHGCALSVRAFARSPHARKAQLALASWYLPWQLAVNHRSIHCSCQWGCGSFSSHCPSGRAKPVEQ